MADTSPAMDAACLLEKKKTKQPFNLHLNTSLSCNSLNIDALMPFGRIEMNTLRFVQ